MKKILLVFTAMATLTACQKTPYPLTLTEEPTPVPKLSDPSVAKITKSTNKCSATFTVKRHSPTETIAYYESTYEFESTNKFISKDANGFRKYENSGSLLYKEFKINSDNSKESTGYSDYSFVGTRSTKVTESSNNTFEREDLKKETRTGRNGYKFRNQDKELVDSIVVESSRKRVYFDDGQQHYTISDVMNGKDLMLNNYDLLTKYTETQNGNKLTTQSTSSLRTPLVVKDSNGQVIEETTEYEETCITEHIDQ
jgi:hypothetical protein